jgi:hypothetical protein
MDRCPHCKFIKNVFGDKIESNREYWIMTEVFVYLHKGKDFCNGKKEMNTREIIIDKKE